MRIDVLDLGSISYLDGFIVQEELRKEVIAQARPATLLLCEHPHTITITRNARPDLHVIDYRILRRRNVELICGVSRGGELTYHGPGQLMGYLVFDLREFGRDISSFLNAIETLLIRTLCSFGIAAGRRRGMRGVWCEDRKIASIGIGVKKWVSMHGFALNIATDLSFFKLIRPCGLNVEMTSMEKELGYRFSVDEVKERCKQESTRFFYENIRKQTALLAT